MLKQNYRLELKLYDLMNKKIKEKKSFSLSEANELLAKLDEAKKDLFGLRYNKATKELKNTSLLKKNKKNIARIKTMISDKMMGKIK